MTLGRLSAIAIACLTALTAVASGSSVARADDGPVRVTITGVAPVALGVGTTLTLRGTIANTGLTPVTSLSVRLTISSTTVTERRGLRKAVESESGYGSYPLPDTTTDITESLAPGAKADYRLSVDVDALPLTAPGVYVVGVEAVGYGSAGYLILDSERTLIPYLPERVAPVNVTWLWPLATTPAQAPDDVLLGDAIPEEISPGGRLDGLLTAGESSPGISWIVDPQLLQVAADMSNGYLVDRAGEIRAGTSADAAAAWLRRARQLLGTRDEPSDGARGGRPRTLWAMPYADPDADALIRGELTTDLVRSATVAPTATERHLGRPPDGTMAWAAGGRLDSAAVDVLASAGVRTIIVRQRSLPTAFDPGYTTSGYADVESSSGRVRALIADPGLLAALDMPQGNPASILAARQRFLSELAFVALEPTSQSRYLVAAPPSPRWDPNPRLLRALIASLRGTTWTRLVPVSTVIALPANGPARVLEADARRGRELSDDYLARIRDLQASVQSLRIVLAEPLEVTAPISAALLRAESSAWRTRAREGGRLLDSISASISTSQERIYVVPRDGVVFSGDRGSVPVTVANDFDQPVSVGVIVTAEPAARLESEPLPAVVIEPGKRASLEVPVRIVGGDALTVSVQLTDPTGQPFGDPIALELRTTAYSRAALWVAVAAGVVLVLLVVFDIVRRSRQRRVRRTEAA